jgi:hypothetical protein
MASVLQAGSTRAAIGLLFVRLLCDCFKSRRRLEAEILILRHQLNVLRQRAPRRGLHLRWVDRALFIWLYRRCPRLLNTPQKVVWRARIVSLASDGLTAEGISAAVGKSLLTVRRWRRRYAVKGVDGLLKDTTRPSRLKPLTPEKVRQVVEMTLHGKPPNATHWAGSRRFVNRLSLTEH